MRNRLLFSVVGFVALLAGLSAAHAQTKAPSGDAKAQNAGVLDLSGNWKAAPHENNNSFSVTDQSGSKIGTPEDDVPYQPWALAKLLAERPEAGPHATFLNTTDPRVKYCDPVGIPRIFLIPNQFKFVQTPGVVYILFEYGSVWIPVAMNRQHLPDPDPTWWGDSIGKYEGNAFVVDTIGFNDKTWVDRLGRPHSEDLHLIERFERPTHETLKLDVTIDDPKAYTKTWTGHRNFALSNISFQDRSCSLSEYEHFRESVIDPVTKPSGDK